MKNTLILDTCPLVALFNRNDYYHEASQTCLRELQVELITTWMVVTEASHLLRKSVQAQLNLLEWIRRGGLKTWSIDLDDIPQLMELMEKYKDLPMDLADGSLVLLAQKHNIRDVLSIDSDYDVYRIFKQEPFINHFKHYM
ncbi:MAG: type II toxin-antitoxin system VapC family toxin [Campylobacterales bacterium]